MTTLTERIDFIKKIHLFSKLSEDDLNDVAQALVDEEYKADTRIIAQGTRGETFYIVYKGYVKVVRRKGREEVKLAQLVPHDYFGEEEIFHKQVRTASIMAATDCSILALHGNKIQELMKRVPSFKPTFAVVIASHRLWRRLQFSWVRPEEVVYFLARKHPVQLWNALIWPVFSLILPLLGFLWGVAAGSQAAIAIALAIGLIISLWIIWRVVDWGNDYYMVTNQRVVWVEKVVGIFDSRTEAPLSTVLSVGVETDQLGRWLGYGNVIVRTFVGKIAFNHVGHPDYAANMIEEYWSRTKEFALSAEKEAMKDSIRKRLNLPVPDKPAPPADNTPKKPRRRPNIVQVALSNIFRLRIEDGETVIYRKHGIILLQQIWQPTAVIFLLLAGFIWRGVLILTGAVTWPDTILFILPVLGLPLLGWWIYQYVDWANDIFQVTGDQIIDIDRTPFGTTERRAASLENILSIESKRVGFWGNVFNYGTVYIVVGGTKLEFQDVFDPNTVQSDIDRRRMARLAAKAAVQAAAERERMAEWIATYHRGSEEFRREETLKLEQDKNKPENPE